MCLHHIFIKFIVTVSLDVLAVGQWFRLGVGKVPLHHPDSVQVSMVFILILIKLVQRVIFICLVYLLAPREVLAPLAPLVLGLGPFFLRIGQELSGCRFNVRLVPLD